MESKLKAFTLFELVLGMLLATIVIGMAYYASSIFTRLFEGYSKTNRLQSELLLFKKVVSKDVENAATVMLQDGQLLLKDEAGRQILSYELAKDVVLRRSIQTDTFKLDNVLLQGSFEREVQASGWVDLLVFHFTHVGKPVLFQVKKYYSARDLFQLKR